MAGSFSIFGLSLNVIFSESFLDQEENYSYVSIPCTYSFPIYHWHKLKLFVYLFVIYLPNTLEILCNTAIRGVGSGSCESYLQSQEDL